MTPLRFRAWHPEERRMYWVNIDEYMTWHEMAQEEHMPMAARKTGLMQSTGLKDKNGKEIFEGDVVQFTSFGVKRVEVKWGEWSCDCCQYVHGYAFPYAESDREVIGNIYENPDLLPSA